MKIVCIGNYPPRKCGIATFTENLVKAIEKAAMANKKHVEIEVIAMNDADQAYAYPPIVKHQINDQKAVEYTKIADYINGSGAEICLVQHEYGIYGGESGVFLLGLLRRLRVPVFVTMHTVLEKPGFHQEEVMKKIGLYASCLVVMSHRAVDMLKQVFYVPEHKIYLIEHGVPDFEALKSTLPASPPEWKDKTIMLTFGLIGRSKGIETALKALPEVVSKHPNLHYVVAGKTHPHVVRYEGESYREKLMQMVYDLNLTNNVSFADRYLSEEELMSWLLAADLYVTPYHNKAQITSGTLSYAVAGGCAVLSTPYWHAEELLADGKGELFEFGDAAELSKQINNLLTNRHKLKKIQDAAYNYGIKISWPNVGWEYLQAFYALRGNIKPGNKSKAFAYISNTKYYEQATPAFDPAHLERLTDNTGILQHANGCTPRYDTGYCVDDNARALLLSLMAYERFGEQVYAELAVKYLSFLRHMLLPDGSFINFLTYDNNQLDIDFSDDAFGRAFWALGHLIQHAPNDAMFHFALEMFYTCEKQLEKVRYARGFANSIFGVYGYIKRFPDQEKYLQILNRLASELCAIYERHQKARWNWFEDTMTYDNGLLPASLYLAYERTGVSRYRQIADESTAFLESKCFKQAFLTPIGNKKWLGLDASYDVFAQQPIDATGMVVLYDILYKQRKDQAIADKLKRCFQWFLGFNELDLPLVDSETGGCNDGIETRNINRNQGAESTTAWLLAWLVAEPYFLILPNATH